MSRSGFAREPSDARFDWAELDLYRFFAFVFASPSRERFDALAQPALQRALVELWQELDCPGELSELDWFSNYEQYEASYIALFDVGVPEPPVPLLESAHDKTRPAQEIALENTWFYEILGLKSDASRGTPDYLISQLEFLAAVHYAREQAQDVAARRSLAHLEKDFLERHLLNWVPIARDKLSRISPTAFVPFLTLLAKFLQNRRDQVPS